MLALAAWLLIAGQAAGPPALPADPTLAEIAERGRLLYAYDQAAWHGTDDLLANHKAVVPKRGGYVVDGPVTAPRIVFYDTDSDRAVYVAHVVDGRVVDAATPTGAEAALSPLDRRLIAAREAATAAVAADRTIAPCAPAPFNTVVIPPATPDGTISVYLLTPQTSNDTVPLGGHFRVDIDAGGKAGPVRRFTHACLAMPTHPPLRAGAKPVAMVVSQLIGDRPTEIHVFASLTLHTPIAVVTGQGADRAVWMVTGPRIAPPQALNAKGEAK